MCWNQAILSSIKAEPVILSKEASEENNDKSEQDSYDPEWLSKAQQMMTDFAAIHDLSGLIGRVSII